MSLGIGKILATTSPSKGTTTKFATVRSRSSVCCADGQALADREFQSDRHHYGDQEENYRESRHSEIRCTRSWRGHPSLPLTERLSHGGSSKYEIDAFREPRIKKATYGCTGHLIYEMHMRELTRHPSSGVEERKRGTQFDREDSIISGNSALALSNCCRFFSSTSRMPRQLGCFYFY